MFQDAAVKVINKAVSTSVKAVSTSVKDVSLTPKDVIYKIQLFLYLLEPLESGNLRLGIYSIIIYKINIKRIANIP